MTKILWFKHVCKLRTFCILKGVRNIYIPITCRQYGINGSFSVGQYLFRNFINILGVIILFKHSLNCF